MRASVTDPESYIAGILADRPNLPSGAKEDLMREMNALQQLYFLRFCRVLSVCTASVTAARSVNLESTLLPAVGNCACRIASVSVGGELLRAVPYEDFEEAGGKCFTLLDETLNLSEDCEVGEELRIVFRWLPPLLTLSAGHITGSVYIPDVHLPLLYRKMRETVCRLAGDHDEADLWAQGYNDFLSTLDELVPPVSSRKAL